MNDDKDLFRQLIIELIDVSEDLRESEILTVLDRVSPDPEYLNYIYNIDDYYDEENNLDVNKVVEKVFSYKPILL